MIDDNGYMVCNPGIPLEGDLSDDERKTLKSKLIRTLNWIGVKMPAEVELNGKKLPLGEVVWDLLNKKDCFTEDEKKVITDLELALEKKLREDVRNIDTDERKTEAIDHYCEALGLMRAIISLKGMLASDRCERIRLTKKIRDRRKEETENWLSFLKSLDLYKPT
ncbi:MAG: hypothetical protein A4E28_01891 [Methanocella sp. PtaU1.Bin125]|nr:MAG: hypothetical protein A4E28_01891 [Methanocella sp. PtaU1.Bin125]